MGRIRGGFDHQDGERRVELEMPELFQNLDNYAKIISLVVLVVLLAWETVLPCYAFFTNHLKSRVFHGAINFVLTIVNALLIGLVYTSLWLNSAVWASNHGFGLLNLLSLPLWLDTVIAILLFDIWTYWWHRISHVIPMLWRFHRIHHSDLKMDVTTANRFHFGEITISSLLRIPIILLIGADIWQLALYEALMFPVVQFQHANVRLPEKIDRLIRIFLTSPAMHKVHHSDYYKETNSNYTSLLSVWDRLFGSFRTRKDLENIRMGLKEFRSEEEQTLTALLKNPMLSVKQNFKKDSD